MIRYWTEFNYLKSKNPLQNYDNNIYSFDIETTSYFVLDEKIYSMSNYLSLSQKEKDRCTFKSTMYVWQFGINDVVYFGRSWADLEKFLLKIDFFVSEKKILYIHNASFEFQFLKSHFEFKNVFARKSHKILKADFSDFNFQIRCTYFMSNSSLKALPKLFNLKIKKKEGDLNYNLLRNSKTLLTIKELKYCENDCLVIYHYIKFLLKEYKTLKNIPLTSTGQVRKEFKDLVYNNVHYTNLIRKSINTNPKIYNLLVEVFAGGYVHANWIYVNEILKNVFSFDFCSSYPFVLVTEKYPMSEFKISNIKLISDISNRYAYILIVELFNVKTKYFNTFISKSKCREIKGGVFDNGRIISADYIKIALTDVDFKLFYKCYDFSYNIIESYYAKYNYLPIEFVNFVLLKYIKKTEFKDRKGFELEYAKEKNKFNALYGMSVTNTIRSDVIFENGAWIEKSLTNFDIIEKLNNEKSKGFFSFSTGVWVTAYARRNLIENIIKLDDFSVYSDTDSIKLIEGFDINIINNYNNNVLKLLKKISSERDIPLSKFMPVDKNGISHPLGVFEKDGHYLEFKTLGAKKYVYRNFKDNELHITVAGVPKNGAKDLKNEISNFSDDLIFNYSTTKKNTIAYCENQESDLLVDYQENCCKTNDKSGCCTVPCEYTLKESLIYAGNTKDDSTSRELFKEKE